jgi:hypothetical protein
MCAMRRVMVMSLALMGCALVAPPRIEAQRGPGRSASAELAACRRSDACLAIVGVATLETDRWAAAALSAPARVVRYGPYRRRGDATVHLAVFETSPARNRFVEALLRLGTAGIGDLGIESVLPIDARGIALRVVQVRTAPGDATVRARVESIVRADCSTAEVSSLSSVPDGLEIDLDSGCGATVDVRELAARLARETGVRSAEPERIGDTTARR